MWATSKTHARQWNLLEEIFTTLDAVCKGSSLVWYGVICFNHGYLIIEMLQFSWNDAVSTDDHRCSNLFELVVQNAESLYHFEIIEVTLFALCDVMAQSILVRPTGNYHYSFNSSKDISLLDRLGLQHSCCDCSVIINICILRYINYLYSLSNFNLWFLAIWIASGTAPLSIVQDQLCVADWKFTL